MLSKIASALARVIEPIKPAPRTTRPITTAKSSDATEGGYSPEYEAPPEKDTEKDAQTTPGADPSSEHIAEDGLQLTPSEKKTTSLPFRPGLTQVILDLNGQRVDRSAGSAALSYETGAKEQKKNARLPKGSMLDKKVG